MRSHLLLIQSIDDQSSALVELVVGPFRQARHVGYTRRMADDVAEGAVFGARHAHQPARLRRQVDQVGDGRFGRCGQTVLDVLVALAENLQVERQHQRFAIRIVSPLDERLDEAPVAHDVKLKPEGRGGVLRHFLDGTDRHGGQRERNAECFGGLGSGDLAIGVLHARQAHRGKRHGHGHVAPDHRRLYRPLADIDGDALAQFVFGKGVRVVAVCAFRIGTGIRVVVEHAGHAPFCQRLKIRVRRDDRHVMSPLRLSSGIAGGLGAKEGRSRMFIAAK